MSPNLNCHWLELFGLDWRLSSRTPYLNVGALNVAVSAVGLNNTTFVAVRL